MLGNLTRRPIVIQSLMNNRIDEALLLILLQHSHSEIVSSVAGVIVNFSSHPEGRKQLLQIPALTSKGGHANIAQNSIYYGGIIMKMSNMLRKLSMRDNLIALLLSQVSDPFFSSSVVFAITCCHTISLDLIQFVGIGRVYSTSTTDDTRFVF